MPGTWLILSDSYHGRSDIWTSLTPPALGVPIDKNVKALPDNYTDELLEMACAVIIEPIKLEDTEERKLWLKNLRKKCTELNVLLIFDEIVSGFRVPKYAVSSWWEVEPDIICLGKALANGYPLAVIAGKKEVMDSSEYFISSTYSGEAMSLAACQATLKELKTKSMEDLIFYGKRFCERFNTLCSPIGSRIVGYGSRGQTDFYENEKTVLLFQELGRSGILFGRAFFWNFAHMEENIEERVLNLVADAVGRVNSGKVKLEGKPPKMSFKR